jgi:glycosyltransferase involved in cell wall biosynthesis
MRIAVISHTYVVEANRGKLASLAGLPALEILLVVPKVWGNQNIERPLSMEHQKAAKLTLAPLTAWSLGSGSLITYAPIALTRLLRGFRPDVVHLEEEPWSLAALEVAWICRLLRVPFTFFTWENSARQLALPFRLIQGFVLMQAIAAVAGNVDAKARLGRLGYKKPTVVLPQLGVDLIAFQPGPTTAIVNGNIVGFVGRLVPQKGLLPLVEAVGRMSVAVRLMVVGNGPLKAELLRRAQQLGLGGRLELYEDVSHRDVPRYLQRMAVLLLPSLTTKNWKEQFGHVLIEAMACGVPVIGSDSGAIPEVIGDAGIVVPEGDVGALSVAIDQLLSNQARRMQLAIRGRERVNADYANETVARRLATFLKSVIGEAG